VLLLLAVVLLWLMLLLFGGVGDTRVLWLCLWGLVVLLLAVS
jgi:hypothetical protein